ncbi:DEAD/DEAH box helicase [Paraburkholderia xenovorans]|uniref:DEAD/DEAH box helicase n=1 Tax=Paraburkholderia xenovorans TaxID=36873 RepID=UPI0038BD816C
MSKNAESNKYSAHDTVRGLHESLSLYIEAQYHIRNPSLIAERKALLAKPEVIAQQAFVEATPVYEFGEKYQELKIPSAVRSVLAAIAEVGPNTGLYPTPYKHQAEALENFFDETRTDMVIATGTGSGKTESFLMPIIGALALEGAEERLGRNKHGCRALLLYPMNALVNDQLARIRRLLGNSRVNGLVSQGRARPVRFGSYTGRTAYPGPRTDGRDTTHIEPLFEEYYNKLEQRAEIKQQLETMGRWPSKDLHAFYNGQLVETKTYQTGKRVGKQYRSRNWKLRLKTQPLDRELMTRDEMQVTCPDVLVTNYSMLEYMLMRPIESPLFEQTADWLASDPKNELILVLDEAHMYRGAGGAEVALLIRRLIARLGVSRDRVRAILTSASLGEGEQARKQVEEFANDLTGLQPSAEKRFKVISGAKEKRAKGQPGTSGEANALSSFDVNEFSNVVSSSIDASAQISLLASALNWPTPPSAGSELADYLYQQLTGFGPAELLIELVSGRAMRLDELTSMLFPSTTSSMGQRAADALLAMCSHAKRKRDGRVLVPTRLHLFHRGLPGLFACVDVNCSERLATSDEGRVLGRFHTKPLLSCTCDSGARVFSFYTHRDCGAAFITGWVDEKVNFMWNEADAVSLHDGSRKLVPIECLVEPSVHPSSQFRQMWLHVATGRLLDNRPNDAAGFMLVRIPDKTVQVDEEMKFDVCPVCVKKTRQAKDEPSKIMDHVTKGEAPFSTLVRSQMLHQPASRKWDPRHPNEGRKVLVFSDGRQKAARLARDMPRDMELDLFLQAVAVAVKMIPVDLEAKPTGLVLYLAFVAALRLKNLSMFDVDADKITNHIESFVKDYEGDLGEALREGYPLGDAPWRYRIALLKLLCSSYYSLSGTTVGFIEPTKRAARILRTGLATRGVNLDESELRALAVAWIQGLLSDFAFDPDFSPMLREKAAGFPRLRWGSNGQFERALRTALTARLGFGAEDVDVLESELRSSLAVERGGYFVNPNSVKLTIDLSYSWIQCDDCTALMPMAFRNACASCGGERIRSVDPASDAYLQARKSFWRGPVEKALQEGARLNNLYVEEHTAQLSNRDHKSVHSTTELHELRFQDLLLEDKDLPIDVLSCTTTMEVGIDIGSLVAVALRNVPPQRENYQQRAGRAGRRGSSVSSVVTFSQNGPHDSYYFLHPSAIVAGPPRAPELKIDNPKIAKRHVHAFLMQTYFREAQRTLAASPTSALLMKSLGPTRGFFHGPETVPNLRAFDEWVKVNALSTPFELTTAIAKWLPPGLNIESPSLFDWVHETTASFLKTLTALASEVPQQLTPVPVEADEDGASDDELEHEDLLEFLFFHQLLPTYAFPTSLCSFLVERWVKKERYFEVRLEQRPQLSTSQALSEYAPGRLVVINKKTYRSGGVFASTDSSVTDRAEKLFEDATELVTCDECSYVQDPYHKGVTHSDCPVCGGALKKELMIEPEMFGPEGAIELREEDRDQDITYATMAQYPQPTGGESFVFNDAGPYLRQTHAVDKRLFTLNKGQTRGGEALGFSVCKKCGCAEVFNEARPASGKHKRPYLTRGKDAPRECEGQFERTFLGYDFNTDLLLVRIRLVAPLITDLGSRNVVRTLESAALTISEALRLSASRHPQLDLDPMEFGSGYRLLPPNDSDDISIDVYLYDTLSGGAGYAELAAKYFDDIVRDTLALLEGCNCDSSCTDCLDHFHNQHSKGMLNRNIGSSLLRYGLEAAFPASGDMNTQAAALSMLAASLELDGISCQFVVQTSTGVVPLLLERAGESLAVGTYPALLALPDFELPVQSAGAFFVNDHVLASDLPGVHGAIRKLLN